MFVYKGKLNWFSYAVDENFTLVFPTIFEIDQPVYILWQWTVDANGAEKVNNAVADVIGSVSRRDNDITIGFNLSSYYRFQALIGSWSESLTLTMSNPGGDSATTTLRLITEKPDRFLPPYKGPIPEAVGSLIYIGKLNWYDYAVDEMITVILLQSGADVQSGTPIYAGWQWTHDSRGSLKADVTCFGSVDSVTVYSDSDKLGIKFLSDHYYRFEGSLSEDRETMTLTMSNPSGDTSPELQLTLLTLSKRRGRRGTLWSSSTVRNDTDEALWCNLQNSSSSLALKSLTLNSIGLYLGVAGFVISIPTLGIPSAAALAFSALGGGFAVFAFVDNLLTPANETKRLLYPGTDMTRDSSVGFDNDLIITKFEIEQPGQKLSVKVGAKKELGDGVCNVSDILSNGGVDFKEEIISFFLPTPSTSSTYRMETCILVRIPGLEPLDVSSTKVLDSNEESIANVPSGTMFTRESYPKRVMRYSDLWTVRTPQRLKYSATKTFCFFESAYKGLSERKVLPLRGSAGTLLELRGFWIQNPPSDSVSLVTCSDKSDAINAIQKRKEAKDSYAAYVWTSGSNEGVLGYRRLKEGCVVEPAKGGAASRHYVWLTVENDSPLFQRLAITDN